jgi:dGTPase
MIAQVRTQYPVIESARLTHELVRRLITRSIEEVIAEAARRIGALKPSAADDIRNADAPVIVFSPAMDEAHRAIKDFLYPRMYRHPRVMEVMQDAERVVEELFEHYLAHPNELPPEWQAGTGGEVTGLALRVGDFIAGMTDRYALAEHARFFDSTPELR